MHSEEVYENRLNTSNHQMKARQKSPLNSTFGKDLNEMKNIFLPVLIVLFGWFVFSACAAPPVQTSYTNEQVLACADPENVDLADGTSCDDVREWFENDRPAPDLEAIAESNGIDLEESESQTAVQPVCPDKVVIDPPHSAQPFINEGVTVGYGWSLNQKNPEPYTAPCGSLVLLAAGNVTINGYPYIATEEEINIRYLLCGETAGCPVDVSNLTAGHGYMLNTYAWLENPEDTVRGQVMTGFEGQNCGEGCNLVKLGEIDSAGSTEFSDFGALTEGYFNFTMNLELLEQQLKVAVIGAPPAGAEVILLDNNPVGHVYYLQADDTSLAVPEGILHGVLVYCADGSGGCVIEGNEIPEGEYAVMYGNKADLSTPEDNNWTADITAKDLTKVKVWFVYGDSIADYFPVGVVAIRVTDR